MKKYRLFLCAVITVAAGALIGAAASEPSGDTTFYTARRGPVSVRLVEYGEIKACQVVSVLAPITGEVIWVAREGTFLKAGDDVLKMDTTSLEENLEEDRNAGVGLEVRYKTAEAVAAATKLQSSLAVEKARINLEITRQKLAEAEASPAPRAKTEANLVYQAAELRARQAAQELKSLEELADKGFASRSRAKSARLNLVRAQADLARARAARDDTLAGTRPQTLRSLRVAVKKSEMALVQARYDAEVDPLTAFEEAAVAKTRYEVYNKRLDRTRRWIKDASAKSPISGVVALIDVYKGSSDLSPVQVGENHRRGREMLKMADVSRLRVQIFVNERDILRVHQGQEAKVRLLALPGKLYRARVSEIAVYADDKNRQLGSLALEKSGAAGVNVVRVMLDLEIPEGLPDPRLGSSAEVEIEIRKMDAAISVPYSAVSWKGGQAFVRRLDRDDTPREVRVGIEASNEDEVVITSGLEEGDRILMH